MNPRYKSTVRLTGGALKCRRHFNAERRERRRPAEASPLCQTRRWTRLFRKFTVAARERQAATRGARLWLLARRWTRRTWAIHPPALSRLLRGVASRDQPPERLRFAPPPAAGRGLIPGVGHGSLPFAATAQQPNRETSLGLSLPSALPGGRPVGLRIASRTLWEGWRLARSRRSCRFT